jgi:hypothetical protein
MLYLVCFQEPFHHARHYLGFIDTSKDRDPQKALESRLDYHRRGRGSKLLSAVTKAGIEFSVVRTWPTGDRTMERRLKGHSSTRLCPSCAGESAWNRGKDQMATDVAQEIEEIVSGVPRPV